MMMLIIGYRELAQKIDFLLLMHTEGSRKLNFMRYASHHKLVIVSSYYQINVTRRLVRC